MFYQILLSQKSVAARRTMKILRQKFMDALHVSFQSVLAGQNFIALFTLVGLLARPMNHDFVSSIIGNAGEILITLVASVQNTGFLVNSGLVAFQIVTALQVFIAYFADIGLAGRVGLLAVALDRHGGVGIRRNDFAGGRELEHLAVDGSRRRFASVTDDTMNVLFMSLQIVAVIEDLQTYLTRKIVGFAGGGAVNANAMTPQIKPILKVLFAKIAVISYFLRGIRRMEVLEMAF